MCQKKRGLCDDEECQNCYERSFAYHPKAKYWSSNNDIEPRFVSLNSHDKYDFDCKKCKHIFSAILKNININGTWCPYCSDPPNKLCDDEKCSICHKKSFASHLKSNCWSEENELSSRSVFKNSSKKFKFNCDICRHAFESSLKDINNGTWCPYCCNPPNKLCNDEKCLTCRDKSFASHLKSKCWSQENELSPRSVFKNSSKKFKFNCDICNHIFITNPSSISSGYWCPYCSNPPIKLCEDTGCIPCYFKSFFSHPKSCFWAAENELDSRFVFRNCITPFIFVCENKHVFFSQPHDVVRNKAWCPFCKNKTEAKLHKWLTSNYPNITYQAKYPWCKNINELPFDFVLEDLNLIIELDGAQHFRQVGKCDSPEEIQKRDIYKMKRALKHGYSIIRILQEDVWDDNYDWENVLQQHIKKYKKPVCIYLSDEGEYDNYKNALANY